MGKAQKFKQLRKIEQAKQEKIKRKKKTKQKIIFLIILLCLVFIIIASMSFAKYLKGKNIKRVVIETDKGEIKLELYPKVAPKTVENFIKLTEEGFYNGTTFHRIVSDFVIQGGDPLSKDDDPLNDETGGPGYTFEDEINPISLNLTIKETKELEQIGYKYRTDLESIPHDVGVISMANSGPNTNGSQFFIITTRSQPELNGRHTVFGRVYEGMGIVRSIEQGDVMKKVYLFQ